MRSSIEELYNVIYIDGERYYKFDLVEKRFDLENTRPLFIKINGRILEEHSWGKLVLMVANYIIEKKKVHLKDLLEFKCSWTKASIFNNTQINRTSFELKNGLFINTNHTSVHCYWLIRDLLLWKNYDVKDIQIVIKRLGISEPSEVIKYIKETNIKGFKKHLSLVSISSDEIVEKHINFLIDLDLRFTSRVSKSAVSLFLIDNNQTFLRFRLELFTFLKTKTNIQKKQMIYVEKIVNEYYEYLKSINW